MIAIATVVTANVWVDFEHRVIDRALNEWENNYGPVSRPKDCSSNINVVTFASHTVPIETLFVQKI